jgi:hypothetical protein
MACPKKKISYRNKRISYNKNKFLKFNLDSLLKLDEFIIEDYRKNKFKSKFKFI